MTLGMDSQQLESYVPVNDVVPEKWEDARQFLIETLKKITNSLNAKEIGFYLDQELLNGRAFIPGITAAGDNPGQFRQMLRIVVNCSPLVPGVNNFAHGITIDANFTLMELYAAATNRVTLVSEPIPNGTDTISLTSTDVVITVAAAWPIAYAVLTYIQEL